MSVIVKIPLDYICVKTGVLCPRCQSLVNSGKVDKREIDVMKALIELEETKEFRFLKNIRYYKTLWVNDMIIVVIGDSNRRPAELKKLAKALSEKLGSRVQVIEKTKDLKRLASELTSPARVLGVNMVWLPDGTTQYVVRVSRFDARTLPARPEVLEEALSKILGGPARIVID